MHTSFMLSFGAFFRCDVDAGCMRVRCYLFVCVNVFGAVRICKFATFVYVICCKLC